MQLLATLFGGKDKDALTTSLLWGVREKLATPRDMYAALWAYYGQNALYEVLNQQHVVTTLGNEALRGIRNPAFRATEYYVAHLWPGTIARDQEKSALPIVPADGIPAPDALTNAIMKVWAGGNWTQRKQVAARYLAGLGDLFIKPTGSPRGDRVYLDVLDPWVVTDFETDARGFVTWARLDVPQYDDVQKRWYTFTEVWSKDEQSYTTWRTEGDAYDRELRDLTQQDGPFPLSLFGIDFVPIVHAPLRDTGGKRGDACFLPVIDKIDELNRIVTRLHQMGFRNLRNVWATTRDMRDRADRELPPVRLGAAVAAEQAATEAAAVSNGRRNGASMAVKEEWFIDLPGATDLKSLVPALPYADLLATANALASEIESDLPEIRYYRLADIGVDLSGVAIDHLMRPAKARIVEARGNAEGALVRANQMACTMGAALGLPGFTGLGEFDAGDLEHTFKEREVLALSVLEGAEVSRARGQAAQAYAAANIPLSVILTDVMLKTEDEAAEIIDQAAKDTEEAFNRQAELAEAQPAPEDDDAA